MARMIPPPNSTATASAWVALVLLLAVSAAKASPPAAEDILANEPPEVVQRILAEKLIVLEDVQGSGAESFVVAYVLFSRSRQEVVALLRQAKRQPEYRPELASVKTIRQLENGRIDEQRIKILFREFVYRLRYQEDAERGRFEWHLDPDFDNDFRRLDGFWELYEFRSGDRTLGRFGSSVDVGGVPKFIQKKLSRKTVVQYVRNCREWIDSDGEWRP